MSLRVAVHHSDGAVSAYYFGRVEDGVHNTHPVFGSVPIDEFIETLVDRAKKDFPDDDIVVERMIMNPSSTEDESVWIADNDFDLDRHTPTRAGNSVTGPELQTLVKQEAN